MRKKIAAPKKIRKIYLPSLRLVFLIVLILGILFWSYYGLFVLEIAKINEIIVQIPENFASKSAEIRQTYIDSAKNNIFWAWLLKNNVDIFLKHDEFYGGEIEVDLFKKQVILKPKIRNENSLWCDKNHEVCLAIDDNGYVSREVTFMQGANILLIESSDNLLPSRGAQLKNSDIYFYLKKISDLLVRNGFINEKYEAINQIDANAFLMNGFYLKLSSDLPYDDAVNYFLKLYNSLNDDEKANLEYIDLRIGNKVFYKVKNSI